jgi:SAM-dependent methyltransferase
MTGHSGCPLCGGTDIDTPVLRLLARCRSCDLIFLLRTPELPAEVAALYAGDYFTGGEFGDYAKQHQTFARNFRAYLDRMRQAGASGGRLLEVGCAYGFFLEQAQSSFDASGIDVNAPAIDAAKALGVRAEFAEFLSYTPAATPDVVCMWDTIEHLLDPVAYVRRAHALLADQGWLFLTTGDIGSAMARFRGARWRMIHPPSHVNYFSRKTITRLLNDAGFDVTLIRSVGTHRDARNAFHLLSLFSKRPLVRRLASAGEGLFERGLPSFGFYVNLHDIMFVAARKRVRS